MLPLYSVHFIYFGQGTVKYENRRSNLSKLEHDYHLDSFIHLCLAQKFVVIICVTYTFFHHSYLTFIGTMLLINT